MRRISIALAMGGLLTLGCDGPPPTSPTTPAVSGPLFEIGGSGVVHRVSVGSSDILPPGVDANFSLIAIEYGDGRMMGQWHDQFAGGVGIHVDVNCVQVLGNEAWISGVITTGPFTGLPSITRVADNGTSVNDPPDQISFSFVGLAIPCTAMPPLPLFPITNGEVKVE